MPIKFKTYWASSSGIIAKADSLILDFDKTDIKVQSGINRLLNIFDQYTILKAHQRIPDKAIR